jgi:hypothetical protein
VRSWLSTWDGMWACAVQSALEWIALFLVSGPDHPNMLRTTGEYGPVVEEPPGRWLTVGSVCCCAYRLRVLGFADMLLHAVTSPISWQQGQQVAFFLGCSRSFYYNLFASECVRCCRCCSQACSEHNRRLVALAAATDAFAAEYVWLHASLCWHCLLKLELKQRGEAYGDLLMRHWWL